MKVEKLIEEIYDFEGNAEEWLLFEEQVKKGANGEIKKMHDELNNFIYAEIGK